MIFLTGSNLAFADGDLWDNFGDQNSYGQKPVTDEEFERALESKKGKPQKQKDKLLRDGETIQQSNETAFLSKMPKELPILLVPLELEINEKMILPVGHYQVAGEKKDGKIYLKLYQAYNLCAKFEATETNDDFGEENINFVTLKDSEDGSVIIGYGSVEYNAYAIVKVAKQQKDDN